MNTLKYKVTIKNGKLDLPPLDLPEVTVVEAILLVSEAGKIEVDGFYSTYYAKKQF